ncbi:VCBS repeat-containing protein [Flavihumibacter sp. UBA7668]|uniref:VCBS repeat-containing protein n=1 Tax=Flavihumibacter sp. UBA7668 TaxID=1946542 RepID=UPI0025C11CFF|nr:VCBS repeat-containing protein [Flavihumibacter sp. UBA7668]
MKSIPIFICFCLLIACQQEQPATLFQQVPANKTGIHFSNNIDPYAKVNIFDYLYYYNGGGVAAGDINNDGLDDLYFVSNQQSNKLYLNKGNLQFEDITQSAGVGGNGNWNTGVTFADVNSDGLVDLYVCSVGGYSSFTGRNQLFINEGNNHFSEQAEKYGLAIEGFNTQAVFFDYDRDGDLDCFLVNHSVHSPASMQDSSIRHKPDLASGDKLFRNDRLNGRSVFVEVTKEAGIFSSTIGYGLNAIVGDLNNDGWEDIYVSNDFHEEDYFYINQQNGSFQEINKSAFAHESRFSMGSDMADVNNDGWLDIFTADMLPDNERIVKESLSDDPLSIYEHKQRRWGYHPQFSRNALQLNGKSGLLFYDIALYSGTAASDWSWAPLLADFNNDGIKDLFISNGILKRPNNLDFLKYAGHQASLHAPEEMRKHDRDKLEKMPEGKVPNKIYEGIDGYRFTEQTNNWGFKEAGISTGACYSDLDGDGDLDIVVNNTNSPAGIFENSSNLKGGKALQIRLRGDSLNSLAYGAKIRVDAGSRQFFLHLTASRGFQSASSSWLHVGLGNDSVINQLMIDWPNGKSELFKGPYSSGRLSLSIRSGRASNNSAWPRKNDDKKFLREVRNTGIDFVHKEDAFNDLTIQELMPQRLSTEGPALAIGDINGDGLEDFFTGGAKGQAGKLYLQTKQTSFVEGNNEVFLKDRLCEDVDAVFFDADGDGDPDLYVVSGGNEYFEGAVPLYDRLYINDGKGVLKASVNRPGEAINKSSVAAADIDLDGDMDLFIGGRSVVGKYGQSPISYLLLNDGKGNFSRPHSSFSASSDSIGMVTDAAFADLNKDGWMDLVVVGDWMPVMVFMNEIGQLKKTDFPGMATSTGFWKSICIADINQDGYPDLLAGNLGTNSKINATNQFPLILYHGSLSGTQSYDQLLAVYRQGQYVSFFGKEELEKRFPAPLRKKYPNYASFANESIEQVFGDALKKLKKLEITELRSMVFLNEPGKSFKAKPLPAQIQWSAVYSFYQTDINKDGHPDFLCGGNFSGVSPYEGQYDAGYGWILKGDGKAGFNVAGHDETGWISKGELRKISGGRSNTAREFILIARNNQPVQVIEKNQ